MFGLFSGILPALQPSNLGSVGPRKSRSKQIARAARGGSELHYIVSYIIDSYYIVCNLIVPSKAAATSGGRASFAYGALA